MTFWKKRLSATNRRVAVAVALKIAEYVFPKSVEQAIQLGTEASPEKQREDRRITFLGQMTDMMLTKSKNYDLPLPPDLEKLRDEMDGRSKESALE